MAALNTVIAGGDITKSSFNYGTSPAGTILQGGDKLTVTTAPGTVCHVWNVGKVSRPVAASDTPTIVDSGSSEEFGPFPGTRVFWFGFGPGGDRASYSISRDE